MPEQIKPFLDYAFGFRRRPDIPRALNRWPTTGFLEDHDDRQEVAGDSGWPSRWWWP